MDTSSKLRELAERHGLQVSYSDVHGIVRTASQARLVEMLGILGAPLSDARDVDDALLRSEFERWSRLLPPVIVAWNGEGHTFVHLPPHAADGHYRLRLTTESGEVFTREGSMYDVTLVAETKLDGGRYVRRRLGLPSGIPMGYHELELEVAGCGVASALVMSAPTRAYDAKSSGHTWGLFAPLYALHTERSLGTGDLRDLREVTDWVAERGGSVVGTLPMLAVFLGGGENGSQEEPFEPSPYAPASRLAWNELYLDLASIPELESTAAARDLWNSSAFQEKVAHLRSLPRVDYRAQSLLMQQLLQPMAASAWENDARRAELEAFAAARPELADYARFRAVTHAQGRSWHAWPDALKHATTLHEGTYAPADYRYHLYVQWQTHLQLEALASRARAAGLGLYLDLPVGVHPDGYDFWRYRNVFAMGLSTGAPPDALFAGGQNWAFPPLHPRGVREDRYQYLLAVIRNHLRYAGVLRIDHVMGLHRIYTIPAHAPATEGMYLRYDADEMYALFSLESHRSQTLLLGENLGTVPDEVTQSMTAHGIRGIHVVQYAARTDPDAALPPATADEVASLNTHDMPPFRAFWEGLDADLRHSLGWTDEGTMAEEKQERHRIKTAIRRYLSRSRSLSAEPDWSEALGALVSHLGRSETPLVLLNLEDLWGEVRSQNVPGTFREYPNWQHRARYSFEEWRNNRELLHVLDEIQRLRRQADHRGEVRHDISLITDDDIHYFNEGTHQRLWKCLGSHPMDVDGVEGTYFAVWAPSADYVSVIGDFNHWDRGRAPLRPRAGSGIWEGFIAGLAPGDLYKYHIAGPHISNDKIDPLAQQFETPPRTASVITKTEYDWRDGDWLNHRAHRDSLHEPMSTYEVHLGSWMRVPEENNRFLTYREIAPRLVEYVKKMAFTHVELMPIMEHPFAPSWGYQSTGYFAPTSRFGSPADFMYLVDELHRAGIGVLLDWVPSHFPCDAHALALFDGTHLYEHADPRQGYHPDWRSSIFNYGRYEVQSFLVSSARYWLEHFHIDGLRVDGVASMLYLDYSREEGEWIPNRYGGRENIEAIEFLRKLNTTVYGASPGAESIAEESTAWGMVSRPAYVGGLGFGYKWDMGWMHDTLKYFSRDPIHRQYHHNELTFRMIYAFNENFVLPLSHDEVVHGKGSLLAKMPGDRWQRFANLRALYGYMYGQPGKKLLFQGAEIAQEREWAHDESLDWHLLEDPMHAGIQSWVAALNHLYRDEPALHELDCDPLGFEWIDFSDSTNSVYNFLRKAKRSRPVLVSCNLTPVPRQDYRIGVPSGGRWVQIINSDDTQYGGSGVGNPQPIAAEEVSIHGRPYSISVTLPPLGVVMFAPEPEA